MIKAGLIGLGKMGLSHQAIINSHQAIDLVAVCDSARYILNVLEKYTSIRTYSDYQKMIDVECLDCVFIAAPSRYHGEMIRYSLDHNLHVFCEKPFCVNIDEGRVLAEMAAQKRLVNQVGYHYRFVGSFREARRLIKCGILGNIHHFLVEAYGRVVLRPTGLTWRQKTHEGGGCVYDYACHAIDLVHYLLGETQSVGGTALNSIYSKDVDDEVYSTLFLSNGVIGQLAANWSDDSYRKMSLKIAIWGTRGRLNADRQECQIYLREVDTEDTGLSAGWTIKHAPELTEPVSYYLRGEEYSAQIDHFVECITRQDYETESTFATALLTDNAVRMLVADATAQRNGLRGLAAGEVVGDGRKYGLWQRLGGKRIRG